MPRHVAFDPQNMVKIGCTGARFMTDFQFESYFLNCLPANKWFWGPREAKYLGRGDAGGFSLIQLLSPDLLWLGFLSSVMGSWLIIWVLVL